jgi:hypothetical protein
MVEVEIEIEIKIWANKVKMTSLIHFNILHKAEGPTVTPGFPKNKTRLIICVPRKSTRMSE